MSSANYRVRRATVDDLDGLRPLWESMRLPAQDLEKRLTEFQVAVDANGNVVGSVGFQIAERYANIHSESYPDFAVADTVRPMLWKRIQSLATNHGIARFWTQEEAPFWKQNGLVPADAETLKKLPPAWNSSPGNWLTLQLKDENAMVSLEKELAMFMEAEKQKTAQAFKQAKTLKTLATIVAVIFAIIVIGALFYLFSKNPSVLGPRR
jgi:hypothetical protein